MHYFFINGLYRSGTTLLQKLLSHHPDLSVPYQPTLDHLIDVKKGFYRSIAHPETYAYLGPCFDETRYRLEDFEHYLDAIGHIADYRARLREVSINPKATWLGTREMMCDEYLSYLLQHGFKVIVILRDIRDVIASASISRTKAYMGKTLPTLYHIRNWRKSVAFYLRLREEPNFLALRYEDLVSAPQHHLEAICRFLGVAAFDPGWIGEGIKDESGNPWFGNSSAESKSGVDSASIGRFKSLLSTDTQAYIDACAGPELRCLGYDTPTADPGIIGRFVEPFLMERPEFPADYTHSNENRRLEMHRLTLLNAENVSEEEQYRYFLFPQTFRTLREYA